MSLLLFYLNDNVLRLDGLRDDVTGLYANSATVTAQLKDAPTGANVGTQISLGYVAASNGRYEGIVPDDIAVELKGRYVAEITADAGANRRAFWRAPVKVVERQS